MLTTTLLALSLATEPAAASVPAPDALVLREALFAFAQEEGEEEQRPEDLPVDQRPDKRAEVEELLDVFSDHIGAGGKEDDLAMAVVDDLEREFLRSGVKDRVDIVKALGDALGVRRKELAEDVPDEALQEHAAKTLGGMAPEAGPVLLKNYDHKQLEGKQKAQRAAILALGKVQEEKGVKELVSLLDHFEPYVRAASTQALGYYLDADQKVRKNIVEEVLKSVVPLADTLQSLEGDAGNAAQREETQRYYDAVRAPARKTLEAMTGNEEADFFEWRAWWNDNKRENWDSGRP